MTWVAVIMTPIVLAYQAWTYWVFRKRLSPSQIPNPEHGSARPPPRGQRLTVPNPVRPDAEVRPLPSGRTASVRLAQTPLR